MIKSNKNSLAAVALSVGIIVCGACSSASTNTVSTGNNGNSAVVVVNKTATATVENVNIKSANTTVDTKPSNTTADAKPPMKTAEAAKSDTSKSEKIGVAECDEYLAKYEACLTTKVPEAQRAALLPQLEIYRKGWKNAVTNPQAKAALAGGCKVALATAKQSMSAFSCDW